MKKGFDSFNYPYLILNTNGNFHVGYVDQNSQGFVRGNILNLEWEQNKNLETFIEMLMQGKAFLGGNKLKGIIEMNSFEQFPLTMKELEKNYNIVTKSFYLDSKTLEGIGKNFPCTEKQFLDSNF